jgi:hypothetical protein
MRGEYDSHADALSIRLLEESWDDGDQIDDTYCTVALARGRPASVELLAPREHLDVLATAAQRYDLDHQALVAAAQSALAARDRPVVLDVLASA